MRLAPFALLSLATALLGQSAPAQSGAQTAAPTAAQVSAPYDPLALTAPVTKAKFEFTVHDGERNRDLPIRVFLPESSSPAAVILFSHGLGGTRDTCTYLGDHWSRRGYAVVFVQHPGSDDSVWKGLPVRDVMAAMKKAANGKNLVLRCQDITAVLDQLKVWNETKDHECRGRFDLEHIGMSGHSFGAVTTQVISGEQLPMIGRKFTDARIDAAIAFSPSVPKGMEPARAFTNVQIPWLLMTGTEDVSPIGDQDAQSRQLVYPALPATIDRYEVVLDGGTHGAFTDRAVRGQSRNDNHHRVILALSTAFFDANLRGDTAAKAWLNGDGARSVMQPRDHWQFAEKTIAAK